MPTTPLFLFAADLHLQPCAWAKHPNIEGDAYFSLQQIVDYAVRYKLPLVLGGDIFDKKRPDSVSVKFFLSQMMRMAHADVPVYFVDGDHDYIAGDGTSWPQVLLYAQCLHKKIFTLPHGWLLTGLNWTPADRFPAEAAEMQGYLTDKSILITHEAWAEIQRVGHTEASLTLLPNVRWVFTGDYHVTTMASAQGATGQQVQAFSPGSTCMQAIDEDDAKCFLLVSDDGCGGLTSSPVDLRTRRKYEEVLRTDNDLDNFVIGKIPMFREAHIPEPPVQRPLLWVKYDSKLANAYDRIVAAADGFFELFLDSQLSSDNIVSIDPAAAPEGAFDTLVGAVRELAATLGPAEGEAVTNLLARLLDSDDPATELDIMYQEFIAARQPAATI